MRISVVIPTWRRPGPLERCLDGLARQDRIPDEVILVVRSGDEETEGLLHSLASGPLRLNVVMVSKPGLVAALNRGLEAANGDAVAFTDDDTVPRRDWLERIETQLAADPGLGGVGGRDWLHPPSGEADQETVGKVRWYGRMVGNHHLGVGLPRSADVLKGANMSFRLAALDGARVDDRLRGEGAEVHTEIDLCFRIKQGGWKLVYDPAISVDHFPSVRFEDGSRQGPVTGETLEHLIHNETYLLMKWLPSWRRVAALVYWLVVGSRLAPGLLLLPESLLREKDRMSVLLRYVSTVRGRAAGIRTFMSG